MRVAIDLFVAEKEPGGMLFATRALLDGLAQLQPEHEYVIITSRPKEYQELTAAPNIRIHAVRLRSWRGILIQHQLLLPEILHRIRPDVLHVPTFAAPIGWHGPLVMTVHDLAFLKMPQQSSLYARLYWQYMLRESVRRSQRIMVVSEQTREELIAHWSIDPDRIAIVHNALRSSLRYNEDLTSESQVMRRRYGGRYLLHVGRIMPRKNVETLVDAFQELAPRFPDLNLVLTGGAGHASSEVLKRIEESPYTSRIHLAGWVPEQELGPLYAGASALVFPSKHEGFGLPTVEAMACGAPVVASPEAASQEIAGDAVLRVDCSHSSFLAQGIEQVLTDEALRTRLLTLGKIQAQPFTSKACAQVTSQIYYQAAHMEKAVEHTGVLGQSIVRP
jgi:glycosyltransferase involved in cell wall biosynthesis